MGDIGYLDETGRLHLVAHKRDMIMTGGENVYSTGSRISSRHVRACGKLP